MDRKHQNCPSFLKLLTEEDFRKGIRIPNAFTKDFKKKVLGKCILKGTAGKKSSWPVRICRQGINNYYICKHAWPKFVKDHKLNYGDYVFFWLVKKRTFEVITYGADCNRKFDVSCDKEYSDDSSSGSQEVFESREEEEEDDSDGSDDEDGGDDDDDNGFDPIKGQSSNNASNKKSMPSRNNSGNNGVKKQGNGREETVDAVRGYYRTDLENPYFVKKLKRSHERHMSIPNGFAKDTNLNSKQTFTLHGEDERNWTVKIRITHGTVIFGEGWTRFFRGYRVKIGDTCKFTLLKSLGNVFTFEIMH